MGRSLLLLLISLAIATMSSMTVAPAKTHASTAAPADEYFGPFKESILGIRNHINDIEHKADDELSGAITGLDNVEVAIEDWQRHYPHDSWIPGFLDRVVHVYGRAHLLSSAHCRRAYRLLETMWPRTSQARDAQAFVTSGAARAPRYR